MLLIVLSIIAVVVESEETIRISHQSIFLWFEIIAVAIFTVEYIARVYTATLKYPELSTGRALLKYMLSPMAIVDLLAIAPFYIELIASQMGLLEIMDLRFIRVLRLMRLLRIFKLNRYNSSMKIIGEVMKEEKEKLFITVFMTGILLVLASALIWTVEHEGQPDAFPNIYSSMWWAVATLTTVGYGDVYPTTAMGKILAGVIALLGIGLVALPTGILAGSFVQALNEQKDQDLQEQAAEIAANVAEEVILEHEHDFEHVAICPHCGKDIDSH
jgi:voltage-gated potassium channel